MDTNDAIEFLGNMSVMELIALTKDLENKWGIKAEPQLAQVVLNTPVIEEKAAKTEFNVILVSVPTAQKINVIKALRDIVGLGLKECKELIEGAPKTIKDNVSPEEAENVKARLVEAGAVVEVK